MARFLPEYKELDTRPLWEKVTTIASILLVCLFVPATVLGYYAEKSIPGQSLYPVKRGIESMVLAVESVTPYNKALYYQTLAAKRVDETGFLIAQAEVSGNFSTTANESDMALTDVVLSIQQSATTTQSIANPDDKRKAQQELITSIQKYQEQLTQIHQTIQEHIMSAPVVSPSSVAQNTPSPTTESSSPSPTPSSSGLTGVQPQPTPSPQDTAAAAAIQNQIAQTQQDLQTVTDTLAGQGVVIPSPTPTLIPSPTPTPTPTPTHTPTPTPRHSNHHDGQGD